jgi:hypothetical protein
MNVNPNEITELLREIVDELRGIREALEAQAGYDEEEDEDEELEEEDEGE